MKLPTPDYEQMNIAVEQACKDSNLQFTPFFLEKIQQIYEMMIVRHGFMIVGGPMGGKTSAYRTLGAALALLHEKVMKQPRIGEGISELRFRVKWGKTKRNIRSSIRNRLPLGNCMGNLILSVMNGVMVFWPLIIVNLRSRQHPIENG